MRNAALAKTALILGTILALSGAPPASASRTTGQSDSDSIGLQQPSRTTSAHATPTQGRLIRQASYKHGAVKTWHVAHGGGLSCVPFARADSGIKIPGNAWEWWGNAAGAYARGKTPEAGSILAFKSNPYMRLGHVAVVSRIINAREIEIDHANWGTHRGGVARGVPVVDVSEANDWSAVRVGLARSGDFGSVYPTYGFIYDRKDTGTVVATTRAPTPSPALNPAPRDLRPAAERPWRTYEEVAEAPSNAVSQLAANGQK